MPVNDLLSFALANASNVITQAEYAGLAARFSGFTAGVAEPTELNKVWRQNSFCSAMIGQFTMHNVNEDVLDNADIDAFEDKFKRAVQALSGLRRGATAGTASAATITFSPPFLTYTNALFIADITTSLLAAATINVNGLGVKNLVRIDGTPIQSDDVVAGMPMLMAYDGTSVRVMTVSTYLIQSGTMNQADDTGTADAMVATLVPALKTYKKGLLLWVVKGPNQNTVSNPTINVNALGAKTIVKRTGSALTPADLPGGILIPLYYDGINFRVMVPVISELINLPGFSAHLANDALLSVGVWNAMNFGNSFTEKNSLPNTTMSGGTITFGSGDGGLYLINANAITIAGPGVSEMALFQNGRYIAVQATNMPIGFGINSSITRITRFVPGDTLTCNLNPTSSGISVLGYGYGGGGVGSYNVSDISGLRISA